MKIYFDFPRILTTMPATTAIPPITPMITTGIAESSPVFGRRFNGARTTCWAVGGIGCIGLGTDFDGIDDELEIPGADSMQRFAGAMERAGFTVGEIEAVCYKNVLNFYRELLG